MRTLPVTARTYTSPLSAAFVLLALGAFGCASAPTRTTSAASTSSQELAPVVWDAAMVSAVESLAMCGDDDSSPECKLTRVRGDAFEGRAAGTALVVMLRAPEPRVRGAAASLIVEHEYAFTDSVLTTEIVRAAARERDPGAAVPLGKLVGRLDRGRMAPRVRLEITRMLHEHELVQMRAAIASTYAQSYGQSDRTEPFVDVLVAIVLDPDEEMDIRRAAFDGLSPSIFSGRYSDAQCDVLYGIAEQDPTWIWPLLERSIWFASVCQSAHLTLLWAMLEHRIETEAVGQTLAFVAKEERRFDLTWRQHALAEALKLARRADVSVPVRLSALMGPAQLSQGDASSVAREVAAAADADPDVDARVRDRAAFVVLALDPKTWGKADPAFVETARYLATHCYAWKQCDMSYTHDSHRIAEHATAAELERMRALFADENAVTRWFAAAMLERLSYSVTGAQQLELFDQVVRAARSEQDEHVVEALTSFLDHHVEAVFMKDVGRDEDWWVERLESLTREGVAPKIRFTAASMLARREATASHACGALRALASGASPEHARKPAAELACSPCDAEWDSWIDDMIEGGLDDVRLSLLPDTLARRVSCVRLEDRGATMPWRDLEAFESAIVASMLDEDLSVIGRHEALKRLSEGGYFSVHAVARLAESSSGWLGQTARRWATYAPMGPLASEVKQGFWAPENDEIVMELAQRVLTECAWSPGGVVDMECGRLWEWLAYRRSATPTLLEFLWDEDVKVRALGALGLLQRPMWHQHHAPRVAELIARVERERDEHVAAMTARVLGATWGINPGFDGRLEKLARQSPLPGVRAGLLAGALTSGIDGLALVSRVVPDEQSADVRWFVAEALRTHEPSLDEAGEALACALWLELAQEGPGAVAARGREGLVGVACARAVASGVEFGGEVTQRWAQIAQDESDPSWLRAEALWALEYGRFMKSTWLAKQARGEGEVAEVAAALVRRRDTLGAREVATGLVDPRVDYAVAAGVTRSLRCKDGGGRFGYLNCKDYKALRWITGVDTYRSSNGEFGGVEPLPRDVVDASLGALLFDPNPRTRGLALGLIVGLGNERPLGEGLLEATRVAAELNSTDYDASTYERILSK